MWELLRDKDTGHQHDPKVDITNKSCSQRARRWVNGCGMRKRQDKENERREEERHALRKTKKEELTHQSAKRATSEPLRLQGLGWHISSQRSRVNSKDTALTKQGRVEDRSSEMMMALWLISKREEERRETKR